MPAFCSMSWGHCPTHLPPSRCWDPQQRRRVRGRGSEEVGLSSLSSDVNECLYEELSTCLGAELCVNEEGWHRCAGVQGSSAGPPPQLRSHLEEGSAQGREPCQVLGAADPYQAEVT